MTRHAPVDDAMHPLRINIVLGPFQPTLPGPAGAIEKRWQGYGMGRLLAWYEFVSQLKQMEMQIARQRESDVTTSGATASSS